MTQEMKGTTLFERQGLPLTDYAADADRFRWRWRERA